MNKMICLLYFLLLYSMHYQLCECHPLAHDSNCSNLIGNVGKSLQQALHYIYNGKASDFKFPEEDQTGYEFEKNSDSLPTNCHDIQFMLGHHQSGVYMIYPKGRNNSNPIRVYCDLKTSGGGWLVFQRRGDFGVPKENFSRSWDDYKKGFGELHEEFWLGNDLISFLTNQHRMTLRIDFPDVDKFAEYSDFRMKGEADGFSITFSKFRGTAGDNLRIHKGQRFATIDRDTPRKCSFTFGGGWWFEDCGDSNLNNFDSSKSCPKWPKPSPFRFGPCWIRVQMQLRPQYLVPEAQDNFP